MVKRQNWQSQEWAFLITRAQTLAKNSVACCVREGIVWLLMPVSVHLWVTESMHMCVDIPYPTGTKPYLCDKLLQGGHPALGLTKSTHWVSALCRCGGIYGQLTGILKEHFSTIISFQFRKLFHNYQHCVCLIIVFEHNAMHIRGMVAPAIPVRREAEAEKKK